MKKEFDSYSLNSYSIIYHPIYTEIVKKNRNRAMMKISFRGCSNMISCLSGGGDPKQLEDR